MLRQDVETSLLQTLRSHGLRASILRVVRTSRGWQVTIKDAADRVLTADLPEGRPAVVCAALAEWFDRRCDHLHDGHASFAQRLTW